jgi:hypothetical protein
MTRTQRRISRTLALTTSSKSSRGVPSGRSLGMNPHGKTCGFSGTFLPREVTRNRVLKRPKNGTDDRTIKALQQKKICLNSAFPHNPVSFCYGRKFE